MGKYVRAAFNARPFGMPVPPNWLGLAAVVMLGALLHPGFWLIGAGLELAYLRLLTGSRRFREVVDSAEGRNGAGRWTQRRSELLATLESKGYQAQALLEHRCAEVAGHLERMGGGETQIDGLARLCWLHLRMLSARQAIQTVAVAAAAGRGTQTLQSRQERLEAQLADPKLDEELRRSLEDQLGVVRERRQAHAEAERRLAVADAELERIRQEVALVHEQTLLAVDASGIGRSVDVLAASLSDANRWLRDQNEIFGDLDELGEAPPSTVFLAPQTVTTEHLRD